ncbi:MAG TPA: hypothetical protein VNM92_06085 [Thermoanaerobaculia bacterium]|nr:hypothetical protein [Thermoanaerobaculia bacterium]
MSAVVTSFCFLIARSGRLFSRSILSGGDQEELATTLDAPLSRTSVVSSTIRREVGLAPRSRRSHWARTVIAMSLALTAGGSVAETRRLAVGPEQVVSLVAGEAVTSASKAAVASNGQDFLAVWQDSRGGREAIYAARLSRSGDVLDPHAILVSGAPPEAPAGRDPDVVWNGESYLITWSCGAPFASEICLARISGGGGLSSVPRPGIRGKLPSLAWDGSRFMLVTSGLLSLDSFVMGALLDKSGQVIAKEIRLSRDRGHSPDVAWNGKTFFTVWTNYARYPSIAGVASDGEGNVMAKETILSTPLSSGYSSGPKVASDGSEFFVVWQDVGNLSRLKGRGIDSEGTPRAEVIELSAELDTRFNFSSFEPHLAFDGRSYIVTYRVRDRVEARRIGRDQGLDPPILITRGVIRETTRAIAANRERTLILTTPDPFARFPDRIGLIGRFVEPGPDTVSPPLGIDVSKSLPTQLSPSAIWDGRNYVVAWSETSSDGLTGQVRAAGFDGAEEPAPVGRGTLLRGGSLNDQRYAAASFNGQNTLVVWLERETRNASNGAIYAARVAGDGTLLAPGAFRISSDASFTPAAVAWDGVNHLVVWASATSKDIVGSRVAPDGLLVDPVPFPISSNSPLGNFDPSIAWNGKAFLVVWSAIRGSGCQVTCPGPVTRVEARLVSPSGMVTGNPIILAPIISGRSSVASSGREFLVVFINPLVHAKRVTNDGVSLDGPAETRGILLSALPSAGAMVVWDGEKYLVGIQTGQSPPADVFVTAVNGDGTILVPSITPVSTSVGDEGAPFIVPRSPDLSAIFYHRFAFESPFNGVSRIFTRLLVSSVPELLPRRRAARR